MKIRDFFTFRSASLKGWEAPEIALITSPTGKLGAEGVRMTKKAKASTPEAYKRLFAKIGEKQEQEVSFQKKKGKALLALLREDRKALKEVYLFLSSSVDSTGGLETGSQWLVDNYHVLQRHMNASESFLLSGVEKDLPKLKTGKYQGFPRLYQLAAEFVSHSNSVVDTDLMGELIRSYQSRFPIAMRELWAWPQLVELALISNLRQLAMFNQVAREQKRKVFTLIKELYPRDARDTADSLLILAERMHDDQQFWSRGSVVYLLQELRERGVKASAALKWLDQKVRERKGDCEVMVHDILQLHAENQVSIANSFTSLQIVSSCDWKKWFEKVSAVHAVLKKDPSGVYSQSDFDTRNRYRYEIERLANLLKENEEKVAESTVKFAKTATGKRISLSSDVGPERLQHIGYYLIDDGRTDLEDALQCCPTLVSRVGRFFRRMAFEFWSTVQIVGTLGLVVAGASVLHLQGLSLLWIAGASPLLTILSSEVVGQMIHWAATKFSAPQKLPKMDYSEGVPPESQALVVIHGVLSDVEVARHLVQSLEGSYLANREGALFFAILTDQPHAQKTVLESDQSVIEFVKQEIEKLNRIYCGENRKGEKAAKFFFLNRGRSWSTSEHRYIGWERKRGKIHQLNRLILGTDENALLVEVGDRERLHKVKYVITLDIDTKIPFGDAAKMVAAIAHPLNQPIFDPVTNRVIKGYGIIQPRLGSSLMGQHQTRFSQIFSDQIGYDPYTQTVSEFHQDLFGEGSYYGKAVYNITAFEKALAGRIPEESILSHDLLEGVFVRVGLSTDIQLFDEFPSYCIPYFKRLHRWIRGDWQLLPWIFSRVPDASGNLVPTPLDGLGRWKLIDNLRRSLVAPAVLLSLVGTWLFLPSAPVAWTAAILLAYGSSILVDIFDFFRPVRRGQQWASSFRARRYHFLRSINQTIGKILFLPYAAYQTCHAIAVTLYRVYFSRRNLLEWTTAAYVQKKSQPRASKFMLYLLPELIAAIVIGGLVFLFSPTSLPVAAPFVLGWLASPFLSSFLAKALKAGNCVITPNQENDLKNIAWETWHYFDELGDERSNYLIPDNLQMVPHTVVAMRTSPTNIGFHLLAILSACDLGFIQSSDAVERLKKVFNTLGKLERFRGHFYNWYNIENLQPLHPRYISSVDSGNLVSHFVVLRTALRELRRSPVFLQKHWDVLREQFTLANSLCVGQEEETAMAMTVAMPQTFPALLKALREVADSLSKLEGKRKTSPVGFEVDLEVSLSRALTVMRAAAEFYHRLSWYEDLQAFRKSLESFSSGRKAKNLDSALDAFNAAEKKLGQEIPSLSDISTFTRSQHHALEEAVAALKPCSDSGREGELLLREAKGLAKSLEKARHDFGHMIQDIRHLIATASEFTNEMDFSFLYAEEQRLLAIGYQVEEGKRDRSHYDLLASEACVSSLIAIAKGDISHKHWRALKRPLVASAGGISLLSWTGSMFEYLMPLIVLRNYPGTLLAKSYSAAVKAQRKYGRNHRLPWGVSESAYGATDFEGTFQYRGFGVPGMGLKRGLEDDYVVSPYSTFLALHVDSSEALKNIKRLERTGARGKYGFIEAIDYTPSRLGRTESQYLVKAFFAHHQGMILTSINNSLNNSIFQKRFHDDPMVRSAELLLQEVFPHHAPLISLYRPEPILKEREEERQNPLTVQIKTPHTAFPRTHLLSNGKLSLMVDNAGSGHLFFNQMQRLTNWSGDPQCNDVGYYIFIRDLDTGEVWSQGYQPTRVDPKGYEAIFSPDKVEFRRNDFDIGLHAEIAISPEDDVEVRRLNMTNFSRRLRNLEVTSYAEVVLATEASFGTHPTFSKMFVHSKYRSAHDALTFRRVPRGPEERGLSLMHMVLSPSVWEPTQWETSRGQFIGKGRNIHCAKAMESGEALQGVEGFTLDPIFSLRRRVVLEPGQTDYVAFVTGVAETEENVERLMEEYFDPRALNRVFEMSFASSDVQLRYERIPISKIHSYQKLANALFYPLGQLGGSREARRKNRLQQPVLWQYGISGDLPIVLVLLTGAPSQLEVVKDLLIGHQYLKARGLAFDLVLLNESSEGYRADFREKLETMKSTTMFGASVEHHDESLGHVYILTTERVSRAETTLLEAGAHIVFYEYHESLENRLNEALPKIPVRVSKPKHIHAPKQAQQLERWEESPNLEFFNGIGGFTENGKGYRIFCQSDRECPLPWSNVIAGKKFGFVVTNTGSGYTWSENSRENRLTPWLADPVTDASGEAFYLVDKKTGEIIPLTSISRDSQEGCIVDHHFGRTRLAVTTERFQARLTLLSSLSRRVKWWHLDVDNLTSDFLDLEVYLFVEWVLGVRRAESGLHLMGDFDGEAQLLYATNHYNSEYPESVAFLGCSEELSSFSCSRREFLGRHHDRRLPSAILAAREGKGDLSSGGGETGGNFAGLPAAGHDTCGAIHTSMQVEPQSKRDLVFFMGEEKGLPAVRRVAPSYQSMDTFEKEMKKVDNFWEDITTKIQVKTPDRSFDILMNGWLLYQTVSCRLFARTAYYQSGGAYGFRDQLQDAMALAQVDSTILRKQILLHASRQFVEGDVQHWWHMPSGKGVRTRISDDYLWLPYAVLHYLLVTGDESILEERVEFLQGDMLADGEMEKYVIPQKTEELGSVYEHCMRAIDRALHVGSHGLPFIGGGDWNDGMNLVGAQGKGESVWLGWFLYDILKRFSGIVQKKEGAKKAKSYKTHAAQLQKAVEASGWDGQWYRRAFFDDGTPIGSRMNQECRIDSIAQSWSVMSSGGDPERQRQAMESVFSHLVKEEEGVLMLLTPPFVGGEGASHPGYIQGYPPGVRENGAQYTHAASWVVIAAALLGDGQKAYDLLKMMNPINRTLTLDQIEKYKGEPYVLAADVYSEGECQGQAGWTWYTGAAGWSYRAGIEYILGIRKRGESLIIDPCLPADWKEFEVSYRFEGTTYQIDVENPEGVAKGVKSVELDGEAVKGNAIELSSDKRKVGVKVVMG